VGPGGSGPPVPNQYLNNPEFKVDQSGEFWENSLLAVHAVFLALEAAEAVVARVATSAFVRAAATRGTGELLKGATQVFKNGPLTAAGRALTKHPNIIGESGNLLQKLGGAGNVNAAAENAVQNILRNGSMVTKDTKAFGAVIDYTLKNGLGARWSAATGEFIGFLGRGL